MCTNLLFVDGYMIFVDKITKMSMLFFFHLVLQVNQIGSVTESIEAVKMSKHAGWGVMTSHRR